MHAMDEYMNLIMHGNDSSSCELRRIRQTMERSIHELKTLQVERDRVDISLKEYEELKRENQHLNDELRHAHMILEKLHIPIRMIPNIIPSSVSWYESESAEFMTRRIQINFNIEW